MTNTLQDEELQEKVMLAMGIGNWKRLHPTSQEKLMALIHSEVTSVLDELEKKAGWYSQKFNDKARKDGTEDTLVPLSAIQSIRSRYE